MQIVDRTDYCLQCACFTNVHLIVESVLQFLDVCKDPPYKVEESGYAGFILPIEVYFRNKEEPKKVRFDYDLFLHLEGHPPVNHLRCEKLTFNNPTEEFRRKLLKAGGVMVMQEGSTSLFGQHLKLPTLPSSSLTPTFSDGKKNKSFPGAKDSSKSSSALTITTTNNSISSSSLKLHKPSKEHKDKPSKDSKESKSAFRDFSRDLGKVSKDSLKKPKENQPLRDEQPIPKLGFKEPKAISKEHRATEVSFSSLGQNKRRPSMDDEAHITKKRKASFSDSSKKLQSSSSLVQPHHSDKKALKDKSQLRHAKLRDNELSERRKVSTLPPFQDVVDPNDSDLDDNMSAKYDTIIPDLHSDDNEDESEEEEDNDIDSDMERPLHTHMTHRHRRVSLSDGSDSENSSISSLLPHNEAPPLLKASNNQILEVKSPMKQTKVDKNKNIDCDKAYLDELVELHRRLMALRERHILQQIVNLIEETGHFHITNTTFDFDLCSLDKTTVRKLQSYLETSGTS
ncbi:Protein AF-9 [Bagarius yarrelli]|uniref:Protein AF-9 n=1 Tax=Bagarius yarrelli TaxID=175774 RepID=A0A556TVJ8_BAGYA|nr:Protein AF-9 [Bagarius yarrelli]